MKTIKKDELFQNLDRFLKSKGIKLHEGPYSRSLQSACGFLADAVNLANEGMHKTKVKVDGSLDKLRQSIHEATAPKPPVIKKKAVKKAARKRSRAKTAKKAAKKKQAAPKAAKRKTARRRPQT